MSAWSNLPNAKHIDALFADARARPEVWEATYSSGDERNDAVMASWVAIEASKQDSALVSTQDVVHDAYRHDAYSAVARTKATIVALSAAWALIAWPESAGMLDLPPDALRTVISTCDGDVKHQAVLLLPAVIARSTP